MPAAAARRGERGQVIVIMAGGLLALLTMVGLIVDGGNAWAQQRLTQNAADAAAEAGAVLLAENIGGVSPARTDAEVLAAVTDSASANGVAVGSASYTDIEGNGIGVAVGSTGGAVPAGAAGVEVATTKTFPALVTAAVGIPSWSAGSDATAVAGFLKGFCAAQAGCNVMPVTIPVTVVSCDGSNNPINTSAAWATDTVVTVPLCKNGPGNVGWLDWDAPDGGVNELEESITNPDNPAIDLPSWQYVTATGNINSKAIEDALNARAGEIVLIPMFDSTCDTQPSNVNLNGCPPANVGGNGTNQWYHLPQLAAFELAKPKGAYVNGQNAAACDTGNGATTCLKGSFVDFITTGTVGPGVGGSPTTNVVGTQLIR